MNNNGKAPILELQYNQDYTVKLIGYKSGENDFGPWHLYHLEYDGKKYSHFAQPSLQSKLKDCQKGELVTIRKQQTSKDGYEWIVNKPGNHNNPIPKPTTNPIQDRTHDIHKQVCLKTAVASFPASDRPWTDEVIEELDRRTNDLLTILEGDVEDDLPF